METEFSSEFAVVDAIVEWRRKAAEVLLIAVAAVHLPPLVLVMLGYGPPMGLPVRAAGLSIGRGSGSLLPPRVWRLPS